MSKYIGDTGMYDFAVSSPLLVSALRQPYLFYTYMAAEGLMIILACVTVYKYIVDKKRTVIIIICTCKCVCYTNKVWQTILRS